MARYIDADKLIAHLVDEKERCPNDEIKYPISYGCRLGLQGAISFAETQTTADVAPKSEVAREIFEEIGRVVCHEYNMAQVNAYNYHIYGDNDEMGGWEKVSYLQGIKRIINLLKDIEKKYTEENNEDKD